MEKLITIFYVSCALLACGGNNNTSDTAVSADGSTTDTSMQQSGDCTSINARGVAACDRFTQCGSDAATIMACKTSYTSQFAPTCARCQSQLSTVVACSETADVCSANACRTEASALMACVQAMAH